MTITWTRSSGRRSRTATTRSATLRTGAPSTCTTTSSVTSPAFAAALPSTTDATRAPAGVVLVDGPHPERAVCSFALLGQLRRDVTDRCDRGGQPAHRVAGRAGEHADDVTVAVEERAAAGLRRRRRIDGDQAGGRRARSVRRPSRRPMPPLRPRPMVRCRRSRRAPGSTGRPGGSPFAGELGRLRRRRRPGRARAGSSASWPTTVPGVAGTVGFDDGDGGRALDRVRARDDLTVAHAHAGDPAGSGRSADEDADHTGARDGREPRRGVGIGGILVASRGPARVRRLAQQARGRQDQDHRQGSDHPGAERQQHVAGCASGGLIEVLVACLRPVRMGEPRGDRGDAAAGRSRLRPRPPRGPWRGVYRRFFSKGPRPASRERRESVGSERSADPSLQ